MSFLKNDITRNACMLTGKFRKQGYDWWWHSFTAKNEKTGEEKPFFIEYFVCNPALAEDKPVCGQLPENIKAGKKPSYLMVKGGSWGKNKGQLHRFYAWKDVDVHYAAPYSAKGDGFYACDTKLVGDIKISEEDAKNHPEWMCDAGEMSWDLKVKKIIPFNVGYGAGKFFRAIKGFQMYWHAEGMKSQYEGTVIWNGEKYIVTPETSFGYADKNWGSDFTTPWVWLSSNDLYSEKLGKKLENSVFDIGGGAPKVFFLLLKRKLLSAYCYEGKPYEFNFSKFWTFTRTKFDGTETEDEIKWYVRQETTKAVMETEIACKKEDMLLVNYEAPNGEKRHNKLWNGGNGYGTVKLWEKKGGKLVLVDTVHANHIGCEYGEMDPKVKK